MAMVMDSNVSTDLCSEAINTENYLKDRSPTKPLPNLTPEEAWAAITKLRLISQKILNTDPRPSTLLSNITSSETELLTEMFVLNILRQHTWSLTV